MALESKVDDGIEQRMSRADKSGKGLALRRNKHLFEGDALIARQYRLANADQAVAVADRARAHG